CRPPAKAHRNYRCTKRYSNEQKEGLVAADGGRAKKAGSHDGPYRAHYPLAIFSKQKGSPATEKNTKPGRRRVHLESGQEGPCGECGEKRKKGERQGIGTLLPDCP